MNARTISTLIALVAAIVAIAAIAVGYFISNFASLAASDGFATIVIGLAAIVGCSLFVVGAIVRGVPAELRAARKRRAAALAV